MKSSWLKDISNIYADDGLSAFQKVLAVKALRPDYLHTALSKLAAKQLGKCFQRFKLHCESVYLLICKFHSRREGFGSTSVDIEHNCPGEGGIVSRVATFVTGDRSRRGAQHTGCETRLRWI